MIDELEKPGEPAPLHEPAGPRGRASRRRMVDIPDIARRGRTTLRHFVCLLLGGYIARVESMGRRGRRGPLFAVERGVAALCRLFVNPKIAALPFPAQLRSRLEVLGPTYIKLGQILSLRMDILPEVVTRELRELLSDLPPVDFGAIRMIVEDDLARPLEEAFARVDSEPLGSASIAQIHRAWLHDGRAVIIKVVKPGIRVLLRRDADLLRVVAWILQFLIPRYQPRRVVEEFCEYTLREVEMELEAENAEIFAANFKDLPEVVFPRVYRELSGENVLCMDYLDGVKPDDQAATSLTLEQRQRLIDLGAAAIIRMLYEDGFFHADLHPGNLMILAGSRVGFIDLGMVGRLDPNLRYHLLHLLYSVVVEDFDGAARHLSMVGQTERDSDVVGFRRAVREICRRWRRAATFEEFSLGHLILESTRLGGRYHIYFPVEMVLMVKALVTFEGVGYLLDPSFNVIQVSQRHINRIFRLQYSPARLLREGLRAAPDLVDAVSKLPALVNEGLRLIEDRTRRTPESPLGGLRATIFGGFCLLAGALLAALSGPWYLWIPLLVLGLLLPLRRGE